MFKPTLGLHGCSENTVLPENSSMIPKLRIVSIIQVSFADEFASNTIHFP